MEASGEAVAPALREGVALCLSGGGYRAMLFHVGALWRLNEAGYLARLERVSSVSGGSMTAGALALAWSRLAFDAAGVALGFDDAFVQPVRRLAGKTVDLWAILLGILLPGTTIGDRYADALSRHLLGKATLQDLPDRPRFVFDATNLQSAVLWRFAKPYSRDYHVGEIRAPTTPLARAVAASGAFPPFLSPIRLKLRESDFTPGSGDELQTAPYTTDVRLTDGGVYDNLGVEPVKSYRTILVSDGGGHVGGVPRPHRDWFRQLLRVLNVIDSQVRALRKRQLIDSFELGVHDGAYWGIRTDIADYGLADALPCPAEATLALASVPTRLAKTPAERQERLINWGYAVADAALRRHVDPQAAPPQGFPYPAAGVG